MATSEAFHLRRLRKDDAEAYRGLRLQGLRECPEAFGADWDDERAKPLQWFAERLARNVVVGGWTEGAQLLGIAGLRSSESPKSRHVAQLWGFYVAPEARRRGLAAAMLAALVDDSSKTLVSIRLTVVASNHAAVRLYESAGFQAFGCEPEALKIGDRYYDELLMRLRLRAQTG